MQEIRIFIIVSILDESWEDCSPVPRLLPTRDANA